MKELGTLLFLEGWLPFILIVLILSVALPLLAKYLGNKVYTVCVFLGAASIFGFLYSYIQLGGTDRGAGIAFYSAASIIGVSIGTAISPLIKKKTNEKPLH
ncbi:hypothetical protein ACQCVP_07765 [Rossellomorea vietnamensis]|uniref:hypothetical protein n=1 Tax=Rossellomorea vietnamensis TaxID=218284 RepID=UPI003CEC0259